MVTHVGIDHTPTKVIELLTAIMYGGMGSGGGNAWMKIMGIDQDKVQKRQIGKEKEMKAKKDTGSIVGNDDRITPG